MKIRVNCTVKKKILMPKFHFHKHLGFSYFWISFKPIGFSLKVFFRHCTMFFPRKRSPCFLIFLDRKKSVFKPKGVEFYGTLQLFWANFLSTKALVFRCF